LAKVAIKSEARWEGQQADYREMEIPGLLLRRLIGIDRRAKAYTSGSTPHASRRPQWRAGSGYRRTAAFRNNTQ
jgi:hypothetical protein